ncbi:MAG: HAMP domain-containing histidine kinase [Planctomycetes bacterium]|nr:HAMP domain-containing histidine kinase [Planctomycetota bacterium]
MISSTRPDRAAGATARRAFGIGRRLGIVFALLAVLLAAIGALVTLRVWEMHTSVEQVFEEQRESLYSRDIAHALRALETHVQVHDLASLAPDSHELVLMRELAADAALALKALEAGPGQADPSQEEHSRAEARLYESLEVALADVQRLLAAPGDGGRLSTAVRDARRLGDVLRDEMRREAQESSLELLDQGQELRTEVVWTTLVGLLVIGLLTWMVRRWIVRPVVQLREGAARIGSGDLAHRVGIVSSDEIGELAAEFDAMAAELQGMREGLESRVEQRTREFVRAARLAGLGTMAAGVAHEINNPLASIASCAEGLERRIANGGASPAEQREYLQIIAREAYRAHEITSRLLDFARTDPTAAVEFTFSDVVRDLDVLLEHKLRAREVRLEVHCDHEDEVLRGNPSEWKQVLLNLLNNAIDVSPPGGVVRASCRRSGAEFVLAVEDQGPGIPAEHLERIFDPFFTTKEPGQGTGLGLSIVHRIVESNGGRIEVSNTGRGALFLVRVPLASLAA